MSKLVSEDLFLLIKSLSRNEKGYVKLELKSKKSDAEKVFIKVFDLIDRQNKYDERRLVKKINSGTALPVIKNRLYEKILRSLENYFLESSIEAKLKSNCRQIEILFQKGMLRQCVALVEKSKRIAIENELYEVLMDIYNWERLILLSDIKKANWIEAFEAFIAEVNHTISQLKEIYENVYLSGKMTSFAGVDSNLREEKRKQYIDEILNNPVLRKMDHSPSKRVKRLGFTAKLKANMYRLNYEAAYQNSLELLKMLPGVKNIQGIREYFNLLHGHAIICRRVGKFEESQQMIKKMRAMITDYKINKNHFLFSRIHLYSFDLELSFYMDSGEFEKAEKLVDDTMELFLELEDKIMLGNKLVSYFNIAYTYFCAGNYKKALEWNAKCVNMSSKTGLRKDLLTVGMAMNLIIHYELGNDELLPYLIRSTYRNFKKNELYYGFEKSLLDFIRLKLPKIYSKNDRIEAFKELKLVWEEMRKDPLHKEVFVAFDFISWLESKIENKPFQEVVKKNFHK